MPRVALLVLLLLGGGSLDTRAERSWFAWTEHGWQGRFRAAQPVAVLALVRHDGKPKALRVEVRAGGGQVLASRTIGVGQDAARRIELTLPSPQAAEVWSLRLIDGTRVLQTRTLNWRPLRDSEKLVVSLGTPPETLMPHLRQLGLVYLRQAVSRLPHRWAGWSAVDICLLRQPIDLDAEARRALRLWLLSGGCAVAMLYQNPERTIGLLRPLVAGRVVGRVRIGGGQLRRWAGQRMTPTEGTIQLVATSPPPTDLLAGSKSAPLIGFHELGQGRVLSVHFKPASVPWLVGRGGQAFWSQILRHCFRPSNQLRQVALELSQGAQPDTVAAAFARELRHHGRSGYPYRHLLGFTLLYALGLVSLLLLQRRRLSTIWGLSGLALGVVGFTLVALVWRRALPSVGPLQITLCVKDLSADWMVDRRLSGVYHWQDTRQFALAFDGRGVRVDPVRCVWRRFEQYQEREVARAVGVDPAQPLKPLILAVHRPGVGSTGWQASFREVDGGVYLTMVNPLEERLRDVVLVTPGGVYLLPDLSRGRNELRLDDGKPLSAWLESGPRLQNKIVCRALLRESFSAPSRRGGVPNIWSLSSVLDRGQGVLFARASTLSPLLSFPDLQGLRRENIVFVRGVVLRDAQ